MIGMVEWLLQLPRWIRILLALVLAMAVTLALSPMIDAIYLDYFFTEATIMLPALIAVGFGAAMYTAGWILLVGTVGQRPQPNRALVGYLVIGLAALVVVALFLVRGFTLLPPVD